MESQNSPSRKQLDLQMRMAQRQIDRINRVLESGVQAPIDNRIDSDTAEVISRLYDTDLSDADISSCIGILEISLEIGGLAPLLNLMKSESYSPSLRRQAAKAISIIGSNYIANELELLRSSPFPEMRNLAEIAAGDKN